MAGILLLPLWVCAQGVNFRPLSYTEAIELAAKENKMVFIDFYTTWCGPCKRMSKRGFSPAGSRRIFQPYFYFPQIRCRERKWVGTGKEIGRKGLSYVCGIESGWYGGIQDLRLSPGR